MSTAPDISWTGGGGLFSLRVGAILVRDGRVLLTRTDGQDHWFLPGGRVKLGEPATEAGRTMSRPPVKRTMITRYLEGSWAREDPPGTR